MQPGRRPTSRTAEAARRGGSDAYTEDSPRRLHWKTRHLVEWANRRPFIWVDDEISTMDRLWTAAQPPGPSLLHRVDPAKGLVDADFSALTDWLRAAAPS